MRISAHSVTRQGYSHMVENKVCQDYSLNYSAHDGSLFIAIVSDGHGGETYCRSDRGSKFACEIAMDAIKEIKLNDSIKGTAVKVPARIQYKMPADDLSVTEFKDVYNQIKDVDHIFEHFFKYIYYQWYKKIEADWKENPPTTKERELLGDSNFEKAYGATLLAFARTKDYWYGFQIGDGKCFTCDEKGKWEEPILWDSDCFLNRTTSLCNSDAYKKFRYSFSGKGDFPVAVMIGTDGIDDSWGERLGAYYTSILEDISVEGVENAKKSLDDSLPDLSKNGNGDDVSVAWIVDEDAIKSILPKLKLIDLKQECEILSIRAKKLKQMLKDKRDGEKYRNDIIKTIKAIDILKENINEFQNYNKLKNQENLDLFSTIVSAIGSIGNVVINTVSSFWGFREKCEINVADDDILLSMQKKVKEISLTLKDYDDKVKKMNNIYS